MDPADILARLIAARQREILATLVEQQFQQKVQFKSGKYEAIGDLGSGGFGDVIKAKRTDNENIKVAIKTIRVPNLSADEKRATENEVEILSKLKHPNIVQYIESFYENDKCHIVMEWCDRGDLAALIKQQSTMATMFREFQIMDWFVQVCLAVKYLHDNSIIHRDIKPHNVFVMNDGSVKLGDFGISKVIEFTLKQSTNVKGTPAYISPEMCSGSTKFSSKSDVWALGCLLTELLCLKCAFSGESILTIALNICNVNYEPIPSGYSENVRNLVKCLFIKDPKRRPTIDEILNIPFIQPLASRFADSEQLENEMVFCFSAANNALYVKTLVHPSFCENGY